VKRFVGTALVVVLSQAVFALPANAIVRRGLSPASVCAKDVPSAAALTPLIGTETQVPSCVLAGARQYKAVEVVVTGSTGAFSFSAYPASRAHIDEPAIASGFNAQYRKKRFGALGKNGAVWIYKGYRIGAWFTRGGQFIFIVGSTRIRADIVPTAEAIYAAIG
jgi:hypothetical protein